MVGQTVEIPAPPTRLAGDLRIPAAPAGLVIFVHCHGTSRLSSRGRQVAGALNERGFATLLPDLLTPDEEPDRPGVCDIEALSERLLAVSRWAMSYRETDGLPLGFLGASTGAGAALCAAAELGDAVHGVVSRGGRPDLTCECLKRVSAPTLLIVGSDQSVLALNEMAAAQLSCAHELREIPGATHVFGEPGAPARVAELTAAWFSRQFPMPKVPPIALSGSARCAQLPHLGVAPAGTSWISPDDRRSDWAYLPWTRVKAKGGSRWLAS